MKTKGLALLVGIILFNFGLIAQSNKDISNMFRIDENISYRVDDFVKDPLFLKLNSNELLDFYRGDDELINFSIPISNDDFVEMSLEKFKVLSDDFILKTSNGEIINDYKHGKYFQGELLNKKGFATISFYENEIFGIISIEGIGNFNLGKLKGSHDDYIIYNDQKVKVDLGVECHTLDDETIPVDDNRGDRGNNKVQYRSNCVKFYLEGDYALYQDKGTISATADYMTGLFSEMATLYSNESIDIEIKEIMIWVSPDGYNTNGSSAALNQFVANNPDRNADLCHLFALGGNNTGGLAYVDVLCDNAYKYAYSNISSSYNNVPTYSWSVEVITHETGHNLGSRHTHACVWNGNSTQIDDCGNEYYYNNGTPFSSIEGNACYDTLNPILPTHGTIMSYCHLLGGVGIDFNLGFGTQPGDLIRNNVNGAACLTACGASSTCAIPVNLGYGNIFGTSAELVWSAGANGTMWDLEYGVSGFSPGSGTMMSDISNPFTTLTGLEVGETYDWYLRTTCGGGDYSSWVGPKTFSTVCSSPAALTLPYFEGFEDESGVRLTDGYIKCGAYDIWEFETDHQGEGRVQYGTNCPGIMIINGSGALMMDRYPNGPFTINYSTVTLDLSNYSSSDDLIFKFSYRDKGDETQPNDKVWVRGNDSDTWLEAYDLHPGSVPDGQVVNVKKDLDSLLSENSQTPGSSLQIRLGQEDNYTYGSDGIAFDDIEIIDCGGKDIPFTDDFSSDVDCWTIEDSNSDGFTWAKTSGASCDVDYFGLEYTGSINPSISMDDWLFSPGFELTGGESYEVSFSVGDIGNSEQLEVFLSDDNNSTNALLGELLFKDEDINNGACYTSKIEFIAPSNGSFFISFHGYSATNSHHNLYIDDFSIDDGPELLGFDIEDNSSNSCDMYIVNGVAGNAWHHIYNGDNVIASINPNGQELGLVSIEMRDGGSVESYTINGDPAKTIPRYFNFNSENTFNSDVTIRLYFLDSELVEYNNTPPTTSDGPSLLEINHYDGLFEDCDFSNNSNNGILIDKPSINSGIAGSGDYYLEFDVNSFSEFLIHQDVGATLYLNYDISGEIKGDFNEIKWITYDETDIINYSLQRESDNGKWEEVEKFYPNNDRINTYEILDENPHKFTLYRMIITNSEHNRSISKIIEIDRGSDVLTLDKLYPNPTNGLLTVQMKTRKGIDLNISIKNILNQAVYNESIIPTDNALYRNLNLTNLDRGLYFLTLNQGTRIIVKKLLIED